MKIGYRLKAEGHRIKNLQPSAFSLQPIFRRTLMPLQGTKDDEK
ncbi:MAG: hypothetical protein AB1414_12825 [bacterium]